MTAINSSSPHACNCPSTLTHSLPGPLLSSPHQIVRRWWQRARQRHALRDLDDRLLADIGVSRAAANQEAARIFWI